MTRVSVRTLIGGFLLATLIFSSGCTAVRQQAGGQGPQLVPTPPVPQSGATLPAADPDAQADAADAPPADPDAQAGEADVPEADAPAADVPAEDPDLVLGEYACDESFWNVSAGRMEFQPRGYFVLQSGGRYSWLDNGGEGTFRYDATENQIAWINGPLADKLPERTTYQINQNTTQIDIRFTEDVEWSCGHNLN